VLLMLAWCGAAQAQPQAERSKLFVIGADASHKRALMAVAGEGSIRMEFESPGNAAIFSGEFTRGQVVALERLGARFEPVEEISPAAGRQRFGHLQSRERPRPSARPVCGDGTCSGRETASSCPADCSAEPPGGGEGRVCEPRDQEEYQTLLSSGVVSDSDGAGVRLFVIDTGTTVSHPDLRVSICRNVTGRKPRNNCGDSNGHGTHTSGWPVRGRARRHARFHQDLRIPVLQRCARPRHRGRRGTRRRHHLAELQRIGHDGAAQRGSRCGGE
jgi:hypothetical protein